MHTRASALMVADIGVISDIDECASSPCQNYETCNDGVNAYNCTCTADIYTGFHCEEGK